MSSEKEAEKKNQQIILTHNLVPEHRILNDEEKQKLLNKFDIKLIQLPKINLKDPVVKLIKAKVGDVLEIKRNSSTAGESNYYRVVISE